METLNALERDVLERMIDALDDMEGRDGYVSDLAFTLFEGENIDGSMTYSTYKAEQWIAEHFHDLADVVDDMAADWDITPNPFSNPEKFMVQVVLYLAEQLVYKSDYLLRGRDEEEIDAITYDAETIALIRREWEEALSE
jgi:hypothetical protein